MGWVTDDGAHDGWIAQTFADGGIGTGIGTPPEGGVRGVIVSHIGDRKLPRAQYRPGSEVTGWSPRCSCGWRGEPWTRANGHHDQDLAARRAYTTDLAYGEAPTPVEEASYQEWEQHLPPQALAAITTLARQHAEIGQQLTDAVRTARADGASWAEIGDAAGITRQSAHERWRHVDT